MTRIKTTAADIALVTEARDVAYYFEKEGGRPGTASLINRLAARIDELRNAADQDAA